MVKEPKSDALTSVWGFYSSDGALHSATPNAETAQPGPPNQGFSGQRLPGRSPERAPWTPGFPLTLSSPGNNLNRPASV